MCGLEFPGQWYVYVCVHVCMCVYVCMCIESILMFLISSNVYGDYSCLIIIEDRKRYTFSVAPWKMTLNFFLDELAVGGEDLGAHEV